jgi:NarL family two-component system sensor histidine kinase LiaS
MKGREPRLTNMIWRSMAESIGLSLVLFGVIVYFLHSGGYMKPFASWREGVYISLTLIAIVSIIGGMYGLWYASRIKSRLETLRDAMLSLEKGNLTRSVPPLGADEIGRLGEQLNAITKKWEEQVTSLQRLSNNNAQLAQKAKYSAIVEERQRLARELHDAVSQQLFAVSMLLSAVRENLPEDHPVHGRIATAEKVAGDAQNEMRALLMQLRPATLEGKGLKEGLKELLAELKDKQPLKIEWEIADLPDLPKGIEDHLFRIVQESLSNVLRHSRATSVTLRLVAAPRQIHLKIVDNGVGFDMNKVKRTTYGLQSIQERANEIGGVAEVISFPGKGTQVDVKIPLVDEEGEQKP